MQYKVNSEIEPLRLVITHTPGLEHEYVTPENLIEGRDEEEVKKLLVKTNICAKEYNGKDMEPSLPKIMRSTPFVAPNSMLGTEGERWVPIHAMVPHSRASQLVKAVHNYFDNNEEIMNKNEIDWGYLMATVSYQTFLMEPVFFWKDSRH